MFITTLLSPKFCILFMCNFKFMIIFSTENVIPKLTISGLPIIIFKEGANVVFRSWKGALLPKKIKCLKNKHRWFLIGEFNRTNVTVAINRVLIKGNSFLMKNEVVKTNDKEVWVRLHSNWDPTIDLSTTKLKNGHLLFRVPKDKICLLIRTKEGKFGKLRWKVLPSELKWKKSTFLNALGLFIAEGHISKNSEGSLSHVAFSNSDPNLLKIWLNFFDMLFPRENLKWFLNSKLSKGKRVFWKEKSMNELNLNPELFNDWNSKNKTKDGFPVVRVYTCCIILRSIVENLLNIAIQMAKTKKIDSMEFLKGWWAGDGHILKENSKFLSHFAIRSKDHNEIAQKLFEKLDISTGISRDTVFTNENLEDLTRLVSMRLTSLRSKGVTEKDVIKSLEVKPSFKVWKETLPSLTKPSTWPEITNLSGRNKDCVRVRLKSLLNNGLIFIFNKNRPKKYFLTERGKEILDLINTIEDLNKNMWSMEDIDFY